MRDVREHLSSFSSFKDVKQFFITTPMNDNYVHRNTCTPCFANIALCYIMLLFQKQLFKILLVTLVNDLCHASRNVAM